MKDKTQTLKYIQKNQEARRYLTRWNLEAVTEDILQ
jgi:hypothetical protein